MYATCTPVCHPLRAEFCVSGIIACADAAVLLLLLLLLQVFVEEGCKVEAVNDDGVCAVDIFRRGNAAARCPLGAFLLRVVNIGGGWRPRRGVVLYRCVRLGTRLGTSGNA